MVGNNGSNGGELKRRYGKNFETLIPIHSFPL